MSAPLTAWSDRDDDLRVGFRSIPADVRHGAAAGEGRSRIGVGTLEGRVFVMLVHRDGTALAVTLDAHELSTFSLELVDALEVIEPAATSIPPTGRLQ